MTYLINTLAENPERVGGADVDWFIMPVVNPDGYEFSHTGDRLWRKNRAPGGSGRCAGVDLNRNYGYRWGGEGASRRPCDEIYAGSRQFSEPETAALSNYVLSQPNIKVSKFVMLLLIYLSGLTSQYELKELKLINISMKYKMYQ